MNRKGSRRRFERQNGLPPTPVIVATGNNGPAEARPAAPTPFRPAVCRCVPILIGILFRPRTPLPQICSYIASGFDAMLVKPISMTTLGADVREFLSARTQTHPGPLPAAPAPTHPPGPARSARRLSLIAPPHTPAFLPPHVEQRREWSPQQCLFGAQGAAWSELDVRPSAVDLATVEIALIGANRSLTVFGPPPAGLAAGRGGRVRGEKQQQQRGR